MTAETPGYDAFDCGPPMRLERLLGLRPPGRSSIALRLVVALALGWGPLLLLSVATGPGLVSFVSDLGVQVRMFIAVPALLYAEVDCLPWLGRIVRHFVDSGIVVDRDRVRFERALSSTKRLLDSWIAEAVVLASAYGVSIALLILFPRHGLASWYGSGDTAPLGLSLAAWWHSLVTLPILLVLFFGWLWRLMLWGRFLGLMAGLDLQLVPGHPDQAGGLRFVSLCLERFRLITLAMGAVVAGNVANYVVYRGGRVRDFDSEILALVAVVLVLFAGPLIVFIEKLRHAKRRGVCEYGALAGALGREFEQRWLRPNAIDKQSLTVTDFSAATDLYSIVSNVYGMRDVPFSLVDLIGPVVGTLLPFVPVVLLVLPIQTILMDLAGLLL